VSARNIGIVLVRLVALYLAYLTIQGFLQSVTYYLGPHIDFPPSWQFVVSNMAIWNMFLPGVSAVLVWTLAERIVPRFTDDIDLRGSPAGFVIAGVSILGIYFLVTTVYAFTQDEFRYFAFRDNSSNYSERAMEMEHIRRNAARASYAVQALVAIGLMAYRRLIAAFILSANEHRRDTS
jgi:hypothetical protein